ncbi:disease resistance family protein / LRR family protein [Prunus dulcis]|uniref:Disease resistance family protein / LRR family protein n=2 Tax=Prunus dulcis TaxID=3755 RepID=A0A4Y1R0B6_PRUDU|nr:disease resistance family protein / LRR family protein [Prunus dulcis]
MAIVDLRRCFQLWHAFVVPLLHMSLSVNGCIERERQALLAFKQGLVVDTRSQIVSTWGTSEGQNNDCCRWKGVYCSNQTGQVVELQLGSQSLQGSAMDVWGNMSSLAVLNLTDNQLEGDITNSFSELCMLRSLGLSNNNLSGEFPKFVQILSKCSRKQLEGLYLSNNRLSGEIPESIGQISSLTELSLYGNQLSGRIPASIGQMQSLTRLSVYGNRLSGRIPESIGQMSNLVYINLGKNSLEGVISETHFSKLSKLKYLDLSSNSLVLNFHSDWVPPFQLSVIILWSCKMGPYFPQWLQTQKNYSSLDISNTTISDIIPSWFWGLSRTAVLINLSYNQIRGTFPSSTMEFAYYPKLNFSWNQLEGPIPSFLSKSSSLDLSSNKLSGFISFLCGIKASNLTLLHLSSNHVSEELPDCWTHLENLVVLELCDNGFLGKIPTTLGNLYSLETLKLKRNRFVGELPSSLMNCKHLKVFDVAENQLSGLIPGWLLFELPKLVILILRSNRLYGRIPLQLCNLTHVQILDFSINCQGNGKRSIGSQTRVGAMAADEGKMKIEKFDGADFGFWKMQIEDYLYQKKLYQPLSENKPEGMNDEDWTLLDRQALGVIRLTLSRNVAFNIAKEKTTAGLMAALSSMYEKPSASNKVHLMRRLFNLRMTEGASVAQHLNELNTVTTQLSSVGIEFDEEVRALILLSSLPESWNATVTAVSSSSGSNKLTFDDVRDLVLSEEIRRRESGESSTSSVLHTESRGRNSTRGNGRGRSNYRGRSKDRRSKSRNPNNSHSSKTVECWNCGKIGHYKNQCKSASKDHEAKAEANVTSTSGGDDALICSLESNEESWVLDSGASFHATSQKQFFERYVPGNLGKVYLGNDQPCAIIGKGVVKIKLNGSVWELKDVRHIPDLRKNLISVGQLASEGYTTIFHGDDWKISKGAMMVARGKKNGTLFMTAGGAVQLQLQQK